MTAKFRELALMAMHIPQHVCQGFHSGDSSDEVQEILSSLRNCMTAFCSSSFLLRGWRMEDGYW